ncbi:TolB family protein [Tautonia plasticadhaerens]|uniref:Translocation protein TolB n=1 Tax=Tautonia plasticadhaerens TaxID=2527974 RepID=A0A518H3U5_9BACT|nr:LpqB family beta-propeller domain-containing protein [Tautonia plasticadhaerens]QDV35477.1 translocation protein TolB [Tautonia plasticadhaerens]
MNPPWLLVALALAPSSDDPGRPLLRHTEDGREVIRPSWSPDGRSLAFARSEQGGTQIWQYVMPVDPPGLPTRLTGRTDPEFQGVFSPDGRRVLLTVVPRSGTQGNCDLAAIEIDGGRLSVVVDDRGGGLSHQEWPSWSPDGARFTFSSTHDGNQEIYTAKADGSDLVRLTQGPGIDSHPSWSPAGDRIVFATDRWGGLELASVCPDGTGLARLTESPGLDDYPSVSTDGRRVAFVSNRDGQFEIYVMGLDGGPAVNLSRHPGRDTMPTWTPDGRGVTFVSDRGGGADLYTIGVGEEGVSAAGR